MRKAAGIPWADGERRGCEGLLGGKDGGMMRGDSVDDVGERSDERRERGAEGEEHSGIGGCRRWEGCSEANRELPFQVKLAKPGDKLRGQLACIEAASR